ncbi:MAG: hypothetical protein ACYDCK_03280 [Thermoplasmatota archaeon]
MGVPVFVWLDVFLAAVAVGLLIGFATRERARDSARNLYRYHRLVRTGLLFTTLGFSLLTLSYTMKIASAGDGAILLYTAAFPPTFIGLVLFASATWGTPENPHVDDARDARESARAMLGSLAIRPLPGATLPETRAVSRLPDRPGEAPEVKR